MVSRRDFFKIGALSGIIPFANDSDSLSWLKVLKVYYVKGSFGMINHYRVIFKNKPRIGACFCSKHRILVRKGWISICDLKKGDEIHKASMLKEDIYFGKEQI